MNPRAFFIPDGDVRGKSISLIRPLAAIQLVRKENGSVTLGRVLQLPRRTTLQLCGEGFDERTIKVQVDGHCYFIFAQDLEPDHGLVMTASGHVNIGGQQQRSSQQIVAVAK